VAAKSIIFLVLLFGLVCFGMTENPGAQVGTGVAQDEKADGQRLVRELETALKSGDQERIRLAQQRVNAHQQAAGSCNSARRCSASFKPQPGWPRPALEIANRRHFDLQKETSSKTNKHPEECRRPFIGHEAAGSGRRNEGGLLDGFSQGRGGVPARNPKSGRPFGGAILPRQQLGAGSLGQQGVSSTMGPSTLRGSSGIFLAGPVGVAKETGTGVAAEVAKGISTEPAVVLQPRSRSGSCGGPEEGPGGEPR